MSQKVKLYGKILKVLEQSEKVQKNGYNSHQKYHYSTENDLIAAVRQSLVDNKLLILTSSEITGSREITKLDRDGNAKVSAVTNVKTIHKFIDVETGEFEEVTMVGQGWDDLDKGSYKAITGALKYFISKNFLIASEDDPENDGVTAPKNAPVAAPRTFNKPAATPPPAVKVEPAPAPVVAEAPKAQEPAAEQPAAAPKAAPQQSFRNFKNLKATN